MLNKVFKLFLSDDRMIFLTLDCAYWYIILILVRNGVDCWRDQSLTFSTGHKGNKLLAEYLPFLVFKLFLSDDRMIFLTLDCAYWYIILILVRNGVDCWRDQSLTFSAGHEGNKLLAEYLPLLESIKLMCLPNKPARLSVVTVVQMIETNSPPKMHFFYYSTDQQI